MGSLTVTTGDLLTIPVEPVLCLLTSLVPLCWHYVETVISLALAPDLYSP